MDFFFDLFDSEKKRRQQQQQQQDTRTRTGSGSELPPLRRAGHHHFSFRTGKVDSKEPNRIRDERIRRELHRLYLWDGEHNFEKEGLSVIHCILHCVQF